MEEHDRSPSPQAESSALSDDAALLGSRHRPGLIITVPEESQTRSRTQHSRNSSIAEDETLSADNQQHGMRDELKPATAALSPSRLAPGATSAVSSLLRKMTILRSPISGTRFRTVKRKGGQYATLGKGNDDDYYPVDLSSLPGLGYELHDMSGLSQPSSNQHLEEQNTEYIRPQHGPEKPDFQTFVNKRKSVGDGLRDIGVELKRNPSIIPLRGESSRTAVSNPLNRSKTLAVRNIGQNLAREKNQIVVVDEAVDLSSLEGNRPLEYRSTQNSDNFGMWRTNSVPVETQSYYFPEDPDIPNWRPFSMKPMYMCFLIGLAFALGAIQEALYQKSAKGIARNNSGLLGFNTVADVSVGAFFAWKYLPTMITIIYAVLFSIMDFDIRRLEPFYQLSRPTGATASASLNLDHLTMFQYFIPFNAFKLGQWAVFSSTVANIIASMAAPALQNPSLNFATNTNCSDGTKDTCPKGQYLNFIDVPAVWSRLVTSCYFVVGLILVFLLFQLRRKSGLLSDPKGIAGIASMATKSHILRDFKGLDEADHKKIHKRLAHRRFVLYKSSLWQGAWNAEEDQYQGDEKVKSPHPPMLRKRYGIPFVGFMIFGLFAIPLIGLTKARAVPNKVPWLPVLLATLLKLLFSTFESDVRLMEPFYNLSKGKALPQDTLTLDYQATVYGWMPFKAVYNRHYLVALVGVSSIALDILTVTIGSFSVDSLNFLRETGSTNGKPLTNQDQTYKSFWVSLVLSVTILIFVIAVTCVVYWRRSHPFLPREPSTIASVMAFIYSSNMLTDFIDTETLTNKQMEEKLKKLGKTYGLGWFRGRDNENHCSIDEEPMKSRYVHGKPYTRALVGPLDSHDTFYGP